MKRIIQCVCAGCLLVLMFPIGIHADDTATYYQLSANECLLEQNNRTIKTSSDVRGICFKVGNYYKEALCSMSQFTWNTGYQSCPSTLTESSLVNTSSAVTFYTNNSNAFSWNTSQVYPSFPVVELATRNDYTYQNIYYYTFGNGAVDPEPPAPDYGDLLDVRFNTSIAGSGAASVSNIDHITWNGEIDSNGNILDDTARVQIKAIAGNYQSNSRNGLLGLGATSFDYNNGAEHMLAEYPAQRAKYDVTWSHVMDQLNAGSWSDFLGIRKSDDIWLKSGWIYQIRLVVGDYESAWKTIYNSTSAGVQNSLNVENSVELNYSLVNTIVEINEMNESTYQSWMINNTIINMENSDDQQQTDKPWWAYLLEAIVGLISGVLDFLGNLIGDLIGAIVDLFTFDSFDLDVILNFGQEQRESNNIIGQSLNFFDNVVEAAQDMRQSDLIISYPGITLFNVELLPAADYNLNQYVSDLGLTDFHNLAYLVTDGTIAICLISLVYRKIMGILRS